MEKRELDLLIKEGEGLTLEFKERFTPKVAEDMVAFSNSRGGKILFGVSDNSKIRGEKLTNHLKSQIVSLARNCEPNISVTIQQVGNVIAIDVPEGEEKPYSCSSGYFRRLDAVTQKMSQREIRTIFRQTADASFEDLPHKDFSLEDISLTKIRAFLREAKTSYKISKANLISFLTSLGIYKNGRVNNAGVLMFAAKTQRFLPYSETILGAFKGTDKRYIYDRKDVRDDLLIQLSEAMAFIQKHINVRSEIRGINRYDIYELPLDALREAVVNAIIHRDYSMRGTSIYVGVYDDRVEIENPGGFPAGITKENFGKSSIRRNLIIADLFHRMGKVERMGSGIKKMKDLMREAGLKPPVFEAENFFRAIFYRDPRYSLKQGEAKEPKKLAGRLVEKLVEGLVESQRRILSLMRAKPRISKKELASNLGVSTTAIDKHIVVLKKKKLLKRIGPDKGGHWEVLA